MNKTIYVRDEMLWYEASVVADMKHISVSELIHQALCKVVEEHKAPKIVQQNSVQDSINKAFSTNLDTVFGLIKSLSDRVTALETQEGAEWTD